MAQSKKSDILSMFYRVGEPLYFPKGDLNSTRFFDVSTDYVPTKYQSKAPELLSRFNALEGERVEIGSLLTTALKNIPLGPTQTVLRRENFSLFNPKHRAAAGHLLKIFMGLRNTNDLTAFAGYCRDRLNSELFVYALASALIHRQDTSNLRLPQFCEVFPEKFVNSETICEAKEITNVLENPNERVPIEIPRNFTSNDNNIEHRLAYFREDVGINLAHWHWHLVYPFEGPDAVVKKDRRGELFYYLHRHIMARYNVERLCNNLNLTKRLQNWDEPIKEAYFPMLNTITSGKTWPGRPANIRLSNVNRPDANVNFDIEDLKRYRERIFEAIHRKKVIGDDGVEIDINNDAGIDVLGNIVEASFLSPNRDYYGNLHNDGHNALCYIHDPENNYLQTTGVMSETTTAMRDPVFYRWHAFVDDLFDEHKNTLPAYENATLDFPGIQIVSIEICSLDSQNNCSDPKNTLNTFFTKSDIELSRGLDFTPRGSILARITHLNHDEFGYNITVNNTSGVVKRGTVRIFIAPRFNFAKDEIELQEQRLLMIEMDKFYKEFQPGVNRFVRRSTESSVTIPFAQTFRNLNTNRPADGEFEAADKFNFCGCGWPQHMLVPKGTISGYPMTLFAMISDYEQDKVENSPQVDPNECRTGVTFCGLRNQKYPDKRPMGYPFDRSARPEVRLLTDFLTTSNMITTPITVIHADVVKDGNLVSDPSIPIANLDVPPGAPLNANGAIRPARTT